MILKRPYAFLIKHFQKIHVLLLLLCCYIFYKNTQLSSFVSQYISLGTYDAIIDNVNNYVSIPFYIISILIILINVIIIYLLRYKKKPYRFYIFTILEYLFMLVIFWFCADYFHTLTNAVSITKIMAIRDLIFISSLPQYLVLIVLALRSLGVDLKKFGFVDDKEYLKLSDMDNEEFEFQVNVDKDKYKRKIRKYWRFFGYFYHENKKIIQIIIMLVLIVSLGVGTYYFRIENKIYKYGESFNANQYTIQVNGGYVTNKDFAGKLILDKNTKKKFVILNVTVTNNYVDRTMNMERFHLQNQLASFVNTSKYNKSFTDLGVPYEKMEFKTGKENTFLLIFLVDESLSNDKFVLTYQELVNSQTLKLKKIKLDLIDLSNIEVEQEKNIGETMTVIYPNREKKNIQFVELNYNQETTYYYEKCTSSGCGITSDKLYAKDGQTIMILSFVSDDFDTRELVDFSLRYGTINYINNSGEAKSVDILMTPDRIYQGNYLYFSVPSEIKDSNDVTLQFKVRDKQFIYKLG